MALKYQHEIEKFKFDELCPPENVIPPNRGMRVFRWVYEPNEHEHNFLPNVVFDRVKKNNVDYEKKSSNEKCSRCGMSLYTSLDFAKNAWSNLCDRMGENLKLDYTHIASGLLDSADGFIKQPISNGHFGFYESDKADLVSKFKIVDRIV